MKQKALTPLTLIAGFFALGILAGSFWPDSVLPWFLAMLALCLFFAGLLFQKKEQKVLFLVSCLIVFFCLGFFHFNSTYYKKDGLMAVREAKELKEITGVITKVEKRDTSVQYRVREKETGETILVTQTRLLFYNHGDTVTLFGRFDNPPEFADFNYRHYLMKEKIRTVSYYPKMEKVKSEGGNFVQRKLFDFKNLLSKSIKNSLPYPESSLLAAMTLAERQDLPENLKNSFSRSGIRHIMAISGMHITTIVFILMSVFVINFGLSKKRALSATALILILYIIMIGAPSSAVRAGLMGSAALFAGTIGRVYAAPQTLALAAAMMLAFNPLLLPFDIGFQLSFLAVLGIIFLSPKIESLIKKIWRNNSGDILIKLLSMTLSAQLATLPLIVFHFGIISFAGPLTNILVVPLLPFVLVLGFLGAFTGILVPTLGIIVSFPVLVLLKYIIFISDIFDGFFVGLS